MDYRYEKYFITLVVFSIYHVIIGGNDGQKDLNSSELVSFNQTKIGPQLPIAVSYHCMVKFNSSEILLIGGKQDHIVSKNTWVIGYSNNQYEFKDGTPMNQERRMHSCGRMIDKNGNVMVLVGGGKDGLGNGLDSVEIFHMGKWTQSNRFYIRNS